MPRAIPTQKFMWRTMKALLAFLPHFVSLLLGEHALALRTWERMGAEKGNKKVKPDSKDLWCQHEEDEDEEDEEVIDFSIFLRCLTSEVYRRVKIPSKKGSSEIVHIRSESLIWNIGLPQKSLSNLSCFKPWLWGWTTTQVIIKNKTRWLIIWIETRKHLQHRFCLSNKIEALRFPCVSFM